MTKTKKYVIAIAAIAVGSVMYGTLPAHAGGIELESVEVAFRRPPEDRGRDMPPPPPQGYGPGDHRPPPPQYGYGPGDHRPPPPQYGYGPRGHMPPPPHHGEPHGRGHMPPPPPHR
ncbi:MAG: hypothetical protein IJT02_03840 [Synergistaceae bacterium]|nr:hypothetical protein [Synergistaceae bacterium]